MLTLFTTFYPLLATILLRLIPHQSLQQTFAASPSGGLQVKTDVGKINITTHDNPSIVVIVEIEGQDKDDFSV